MWGRPMWIRFWKSYLMGQKSKQSEEITVPPVSSRLINDGVPPISASDGYPESMFHDGYGTLWIELSTLKAITKHCNPFLMTEQGVSSIRINTSNGQRTYVYHSGEALYAEYRYNSQTRLIIFR